MHTQQATRLHGAERLPRDRIAELQRQDIIECGHEFVCRRHRGKLPREYEVQWPVRTFLHREV
jgi:hypothetical protein